MMKSWRFAVGVTVVALFGGCAGGLPEVPADLSAALGDVIVESPLVNTAPGWAIRGTVRLVDLPRYSAMQVQVEAEGLTPGEHAWHIHSGSCSAPGPIVVPFTPVGAMAGVDEPIEAGSDGHGAEDAVIPRDRLSEDQVRTAAYSLHIHNAAGTNPGRSIACGDLAPSA